MVKNKRFTDIEHDYENAWIKCKDDGDFMIYAIYADLDEGLPSLEDLLNGLDGTVKSLTEDYERLLKKNKQLKIQIKIFEKFLDENNLDIDWELFCTVDECKKDSDDYGCKECKYLGDVE